ncbi:MAG: alpha/beta hydrolase [Burkholderiales bacterium]
MASNALHREDRGTGRPTLVFIHGFTCSLSDWREQFDAFSGAHRCIAVDLPGHGASPPTADATIEALAAAVNACLDVLDLDDVVLVGHSMGCRIASEARDRVSGRVRGLVYIDGSFVAEGDADAAVKRAADAIEPIGMAQFAANLYRGFFASSTPAAVRDAIQARLPGTDWAFAQRLWLDMIRWDATRSRAALARIGVPALVIQSTYLDARFQRASLPVGHTTPWMNAVAQSVKRTTTVVIPDIGHFPMLEAPQATNEAIRRFVHDLMRP